MNSRSRLLVATQIAVGAVALTYMTSCSPTTSVKQDFLTSYDGMAQESKTSDSTTYTGDLTKLSKYNNVYLEKVEVRKPLKMEKNQVTDEEIAELETSLKNALIQEVGKSRFRLASGKGKKTLSMRVAVTNFIPGDPKVFAATYAPYVSTASTAVGLLTGKSPGVGTATIEAEVIDSVTRERFFSIVDRDKGNKLQLKSGMSRLGHINKSFEEWAKTLTERMKAQSQSQTAAQQPKTQAAPRTR